MKKKIIVLLAVFTLTVILASCGKVPEESGNYDKGKATVEEKTSEKVFTVPDKGFIATIQDFYANYDDYKDRLIKIEGLYGTFQGPNKEVPSVYRKTPGCCGNDGICSLPIELPENTQTPTENSWIILEGKLKKRDIPQGGSEMYLEVKKMTVSDKIGIDFVRN